MKRKNIRVLYVEDDQDSRELVETILSFANIDVAHSASSNLNETAMRIALEYTYLSRRLMD